MTYYERNLPHWHPPGKAVFITWRLAGLCRNAADGFKKSTADETANSQSADGVLDAGSVGPTLLSRSRRRCGVCKDVFCDGARELNYFDLFAHVVLPNHVHGLLVPKLPLQS